MHPPLKKKKDCQLHTKWKPSILTHTHTHARTHTHIHIHTHMHTHTHTHACTHTHTHTYIHTDTHTRTHIHTHKHTHTNTHTHTLYSNRASSYPYLNGANTHVDADFILTDVLEGSHSMADVIQVLDRTRQTFLQVLNEVEDLLHLSAVLLVAHLAIVNAPGFGLRGQAQLQGL